MTTLVEKPPANREQPRIIQKPIIISKPSRDNYFEQQIEQINEQVTGINKIINSQQQSYALQLANEQKICELTDEITLINQLQNSLKEQVQRLQDQSRINSNLESIEQQYNQRSGSKANEMTTLELVEQRLNEHKETTAKNFSEVNDNFKKFREQILHSFQNLQTENNFQHENIRNSTSQNFYSKQDITSMLKKIQQKINGLYKIQTNTNIDVSSQLTQGQKIRRTNKSTLHSIQKTNSVINHTDREFDSSMGLFVINNSQIGYNPGESFENQIRKASSLFRGSTETINNGSNMSHYTIQVKNGANGNPQNGVNSYMREYTNAPINENACGEERDHITSLEKPYPMFHNFKGQNLLDASNRMSNSQIKVNSMDSRGGIFGDLKLKVNIGDRNRTPNRLLIDKLRTNRKSIAMNDVVINQTFIQNTSFNQTNQTDRININTQIPIKSPRLNNQYHVPSQQVRFRQQSDINLQRKMQQNNH
ncbi:UNKNOWN [Stylonychia lemnae]|uniref:Uncharacterized protein n=1 Tax=Stylonychia lemnae TaxID=5949 RepID=A0A078B9Q5_STYLE|nr:UNKNOWN [Stylonychia lemnae]|eukprot:CDW89982.1 UNKNOWN [Stylonychia lemnae]